MDIIKTIEVLEALASGYSPTTGEMIDNDSVLNERSVIRAMQIAIDQLKSNLHRLKSNAELDEKELKNVIELFNEQSLSITANSLIGFFLGTRKFKSGSIISNSLYGKYKDTYSKGQLIDFFNEYLSENLSSDKKNNNLYQEVDFFRKEKFNTLSENAIKQLKERIIDLGIQKTENLSEYVQNARTQFPRAYESWTDIERELLSKAIKYTNDLDLLSECFQRGKGSIESYGQRLIYESQNLQHDKKQS
ncbi:hypothetical protein NAT51_10110 [Flavobacterium amniphilum]|uniref:hypothetical protein n=1 Tax=Flavobacterium amniphilum TaxID=1834035 RepID=UPI00202A0A7C|nr:hypothetical protein [Flavobacterium amniphilum]MCL9805877.1 hypothetical protein [Flavobacterium amniphilum]